MEFSPRDLVSPKEILSEVLMYTNETRFENVTRGFIISQMNKCMRALSYHTFFDERHGFIDMPQSGTIEVPSGVFNIKNIYIFNGEQCNVGVNAKNVYWKRNYFTDNGRSEFSRNTSRTTNDPFYADNQHLGVLNDRRMSNSSSGTYSTSDNLFFYGESNGVIMFSPNCLNYSKIMIEFNGIWEIDETKATIPLVFQEVLVDWCTESVLRVKSFMLPNLKAFHNDAVMRLGYKPETFQGSWYKAKKLVTQMGSKSREDLKEYLTRLNY